MYRSLTLLYNWNDWQILCDSILDLDAHVLSYSQLIFQKGISYSTWLLVIVESNLCSFNIEFGMVWISVFLLLISVFTL